MPRSFDMATEYAETVAEVHAAFCDKRYWLDRLEASGADEVALNDFRIGRDGGVDVVTTQVLRADRLPGIVHQFHRGELQIRRAETWTGLADTAAQAAQAAASIASSIARAPVTLAGEARLAALQRGSRLAVRADVEVRIPLVGGKMEKFIGSQLLNLMTAEQRFTAGWIAGNH